MRTQWFRTGTLWIGAAALSMVAVTQLKADNLLLKAGERQSAWIIGVACHPADTTLRVQLGLGDAPALVVDGVDATSPAGNAGVKQHDLIVEAGGKKVGQLADLSAAVQNVKGGKLTLELIRGGKKQTVELTPVKRNRVDFKLEALPHGDDVRVWLDKHGVKDFALRPGRFRFHGVHPFGVIDVRKMPPFPKNLQVRIEKNGDAPAKIVVKRDGVQWETTEDKLDKLPEDVRKHVKLLLGKTDFSGPGIMKAFNALPFGQDIAPPVRSIAPRADMQIAPFRVPSIVESTAAGKRLEKQLEAMNQRLDQLHKAIEQLQPPKGDRKP